jgi:hypothetical protein
MINTYDHKDKATYDIEGLDNYMRDCMNSEAQRKREAISKAEAYYTGFCDAVRCIKSIMEASNYRVEEVEDSDHAD